MTATTSDFECDQDLGDAAYIKIFRGMTHAYVMNDRVREHTLCGYVMVPLSSASREDEPRTTRAYRRMSQREGKRVPKIKQADLRDELYIVPGADMSPAQIITALKSMIDQIEKRGMYIGIYKGEYIMERLDGTMYTN